MVRHVRARAVGEAAEHEVNDVRGEMRLVGRWVGGEYV